MTSNILTIPGYSNAITDKSLEQGINDDLRILTDSGFKYKFENQFLIMNCDLMFGKAELINTSMTLKQFYNNKTVLDTQTQLELFAVSINLGGVHYICVISDGTGSYLKVDNGNSIKVNDIGNELVNKRFQILVWKIL